MSDRKRLGDIMTKMYVITRADLSAGLRAAQSCHALRQFVADHPASDRRWYEHSNNLVVLEARDQQHLQQLADQLGQAGCEVAAFREPDLGGELTAVAALGEGAKRCVSSLPLALRAAA